MEKIQMIVLIAVLCCTWTFGQEVASDKTVAAEPLSVVPAPSQKSGPVAPTQGQVSPNQGISGTTHETKNPDGSVLSVTHFNGQFPQNAFPGASPYGYNGFPGWGYPGASPFFYNPWAYNPANYPQANNIQPQPGPGAPLRN